MPIIATATNTKDAQEKLSLLQKVLDEPDKLSITAYGNFQTKDGLEISAPFPGLKVIDLGADWSFVALPDGSETNVRPFSPTWICRFFIHLF